MPLQIVRNDITKMNVDAIVNAANTSLLGGGGVDGAIHRAAGPKLLEECRTLGGCPTGEARITRGYNLPCKYVIHTPGPIWQGGGNGEEALLSSCYSSALGLAEKHNCETLAFPLISSGVYGYPKAQALKVAVDTISGFLLEHEMTVYIVVFDRMAFELGSRLFCDVLKFIDDVYVEEHRDSRAEMRRRQAQSRFSRPQPLEDSIAMPPAALSGLHERLERVEESFSQMLIHKIDEKGITDAQCYKRANIDRRLFNKIKNNPAYKPGKQTALAFAIALELTLEETHELLMKAGYALSRSSKADIVVEYCIMTHNYNINDINEILFGLDLPLLC